VRRFDVHLLRIAQRKLAQLHRVQQVDELQIPPGNRLEKLFVKRAGQWSIFLNECEKNRQVTKAACAHLEQTGVIEKWPLKINQGQGQKPVQMEGL
jgi:hypothetical protein